MTSVIALAAGGCSAAPGLHLPGLGGTPQAADVVPASAMAWVGVDLAPGMMQQLQMMDFAVKFPSVRHLGAGVGHDDVKKAAWTAATGRLHCPVDFDRDVEPWLGNRFGVAVLPPAKGTSAVQQVVVVQATDDHRARTGLAKLAACWHWPAAGIAARDGYLVVAPSRSSANRAVADAGVSSLSQRPDFAQDVARLGTQGVVTAWATRTGLRWADGRLGRDDLRGIGFRSVAATLRFGDQNPELRVVVKANRQLPTTTSGTPLDRLPPATVAAVGVADGASTLNDQWESLLSLAASRGGLATWERRLGLVLPGQAKSLLGTDLRVAWGPRSASSGKPGARGSRPVTVSATTTAKGFPGILAHARLGLPTMTTTAAEGGWLSGTSSWWSRMVSHPGPPYLGDDETFQAAYPPAGIAQAGAYVNLDGVRDVLDRHLTASQRADADQLKAVGASVHVEDANYVVVTARATAK